MFDPSNLENHNPKGWQYKPFLLWSFTDFFSFIIWYLLFLLCLFFSPIYFVYKFFKL